MVGLPWCDDSMDLLPDLPIVGHVSNYMDVRPESDISKTTVHILLTWTGIDSGKFTPKHYVDLLEPFDRITTGLRTPTTLDKTAEFTMFGLIGSAMSTKTNSASSYQNPEGHRYLIVGNHSSEWLNLAAIGIMSTEIVQRVRENRVFSFQLMFSHLSSQWCRNTGRNMLAWRDLRIECADWMYYRPSDECVTPLIDSLESFHASLPWSMVLGTTMRLETFMSPDSDRRPPPHERTIRELRAYFPKAGELERLLRLKKQVDPLLVFDGAGTIPFLDIQSEHIDP